MTIVFWQTRWLCVEDRNISKKGIRMVDFKE